MKVVKELCYTKLSNLFQLLLKCLWVKVIQEVYVWYGRLKFTIPADEVCLK